MKPRSILEEYEVLSKKLIFPKKLIEPWNLKEMPTKLSENIYGTKQRNPLATLYLNNAFFWFKVLEEIKFKGKRVTEIGPGSSLVIDLALNYLGFNGDLYKIDLKQLQTPFLKRGFKLRFMKKDPFKSLNNILVSDAFVFNHAIDDLYLSICLSGREKYFNFNHDYRTERKVWSYAMNKKTEYMPTLLQFFMRLGKKVRKNGFIIIRSYPSSYEVTYKMHRRIKFHEQLCVRIMKELTANGFKIMHLNSKGLKLQHTFFVLQKI